MKKDGYYSSGKFANMAHVTKKTLRYYDEQNILKPSYVAENGTKYYTDNDFAKLQQILFLKYLSFPLADIKELTVRGADKAFWLESLKMQTSLLDEHIEQMRIMKESLVNAQEAVASGKDVDWSNMLRLANINELEEKLKKQYLDSSNISSRIQLHTDYSDNKENWFEWIFRIAKLGEGEPGLASETRELGLVAESGEWGLAQGSETSVLELGCGDGSLWEQNLDDIPKKCHIVLSDISDGIVRETAKKLGPRVPNMTFQVMDAHYINAKDESFDVVIANHMLFYCEDLNRVLSEIKRVLKPGGRLVCSTYSSRHMSEISQLVKEFDDRIVLSADSLYEKFGKENGVEILSSYFDNIQWCQFEDKLCITKPEPLISYILSCHGNQNRYIVDKYHDFYSFVKSRTDGGFCITKDAGVFIACKAQD